MKRPPSSIPPARPGLIRLIAFIIAVPIFLLSAELLTRLIDRIFPIGLLHPPPATSNEIFHHSLKPSEVFTREEYIGGRGEQYVYRINSFGLRDREYSIRKPENTIRILVIGDSFVFGHGVNLRPDSPTDELWVKIIEDKFKQLALPEQVEVINGGIYGYSPLVEYLFFREKLIELKPDIVLQCVHTSDISEDFSYELISQYDFTGRLLYISRRKLASQSWQDGSAVPVMSLRKPDNLLFRKSHLASFIYLALKKRNHVRAKALRFQPGDIITDMEAHSKKEAPDWSEHYERTLDYLEATAGLCEEAGITYLATLFPSKIQLDGEGPYRRRLFDIIAAGAEDRGLVFWDLFEEFQNVLSTESYNPYHHHWTAEANRQVAEIIFNRLKPIVLTRIMSADRQT